MTHKRQINCIVILTFLMVMTLLIAGCGKSGGDQSTLDDTSDQVIPGADWKGKYQALNTTYVDLDEVEETEKLMPSESIFVLNIEESGIASITLDPVMATTLAKRQNDYTYITRFDMKWVEDGDTLVFRAPDMNMKQIVCSRVEDTDFLKIVIEYTKAKNTMYLKPIEMEAKNISSEWIEDSRSDADGNDVEIEGEPVTLKFDDNGLGIRTYHDNKGKEKSEEFIHIGSPEKFEITDGYGTDWSCTSDGEKMNARASGDKNDDPLTYTFVKK